MVLLAACTYVTEHNDGVRMIRQDWLFAPSVLLQLYLLDLFPVLVRCITKLNTSSSYLIDSFPVPGVTRSATCPPTCSKAGPTGASTRTNSITSTTSVGSTSSLPKRVPVQFYILAGYVVDITSFKAICRPARRQSALRRGPLYLTMKWGTCSKSAKRLGFEAAPILGASAKPRLTRF
jgi:hypothetical protein